MAKMTIWGEKDGKPIPGSFEDQMAKMRQRVSDEMKLQEATALKTHQNNEAVKKNTKKKAKKKTKTVRP